MDQVTEIKSRTNIAEVIGEYVQLKKAGRNFKGNCPFHQEKTASFMVSPEKQIYHCFGCNAGGDVIKFIEEINGMDFPSALELLGSKIGVKVEKTGRKGSDKSRLTDANTKAASAYFQTLVISSAGKKALDYLIKSRTLKKETIRQFKFGYSPKGPTFLVDILAKKGFKPQELEKAGLAMYKNGRHIDWFRGRLMLPIADVSGQIIGFTARALDDSQPKYFNSPDTEIYNKSRVIYGLDLAKEAIREADEVVVVEGNMDVVSSYQAGVKNVVAASGTSLTLEQLNNLARFTKNIKIAFDADSAGQAATERVIELAGQTELNLSIIPLDGGKDPDEIIREKGVGGWKDQIKKSIYVYDYMFERILTSGPKTSFNVKQMATKIATLIARMNDPVEQDTYIAKAAAGLGVLEKSIRDRVVIMQAQSQNQESGIKNQDGTGSTGSERRTSKTEMLESHLIGLSMAFPKHFIIVKREIKPEDIATEWVKALYKKLISTYDKDCFDLPSLEKVSTTAIITNAKIATLQAEEEFGQTDEDKITFELLTVIKRIKKLSLEREKRDLQIKIKEAESSGDEKTLASLMSDFHKLLKSQEG